MRNWSTTAYAVDSTFSRSSDVPTPSQRSKHKGDAKLGQRDNAQRFPDLVDTEQSQHNVNRGQLPSLGRNARQTCPSTANPCTTHLGLAVLDSAVEAHTQTVTQTPARRLGNVVTQPGHRAQRSHRSQAFTHSTREAARCCGVRVREQAGEERHTEGKQPGLTSPANRVHLSRVLGGTNRLAHPRFIPLADP